MNLQRAVYLGASFMLVILLAACLHPVKTKEPALLNYFPPFVPGDTLHVEITPEIDTALTGSIPNALFFKDVPAALLQDFDYLADPGQAQVFGRQQFPLNDTIIACWTEIHQYWFQHQALLLYNKRRQAFTDLVTLAEWYGGDGGQILTGSWLFDYNGDGKKDIVRREIEHHTELNGEEWTEHINQSATLLLWKNGRFTESPLADTLATVQRFPIRSFW